MTKSTKVSQVIVFPQKKVKVNTVLISDIKDINM